MGVSTQEMAKISNDAGATRKENNAPDLDKNADQVGGNRGKPVAFLKVTKWSETAERNATEDDPTLYPIFKGSNVVGRSKGSSIRLPFSVISARHAEIYVKETLHAVRDFVSTNETKRNGVSLEPDVRYEIFDGTEISFADIDCTYYVGRLPGTDEGDELKMDAAFDWKCKENESHQSSIGASTTAMTIFKNFLAEDEESGGILGREGDLQEMNGQSSRISAVVASRKDDNAAPALDVLVEESQLIAEERPSLESANNNRNIQLVVRETEQFLSDDNEPDMNSNRVGEIEKRRGNDILDIVHVQPGENEDENYATRASSVGEETDSKDKELFNPAVETEMTEAKKSTSFSRNDSSLEEAIHSNVTAPDQMAETLPNMGGLPVPLDSLKVEHRLNLVALTPASSTNGKTPQPAGTISTTSRNQTSVWSIPTSIKSSDNSKRKRSLMDEAVDDWLFRSEPDMRRKNARAVATNRRRTTVEKPKNRLEQLTEKCNQSIIAAKRVSKDKKSMEEDASDESIVQLASEIAAKVKDPFEFGPSQLTFNGSTASGSSQSKLKPSKKKAQKARKTVQTNFGSDGASTVTPISSSTSTKQKSTAEAMFDEAAEMSRQQGYKSSTTAKGKGFETSAEEVIPSGGGEKKATKESPAIIKKSSPKKQKPHEMISANGEDTSTGAGETDVNAKVERRGRTVAGEAAKRNHAKEELDEAPKPKKSRAAAASKKKPIEKSNLMEGLQKELSEDSPDLIFPTRPEKPKVNKGGAGGRAKVEKSDGKDKTKKIPKMGAAKKEETAPMIKVCFTQLSDKEQLAKLQQAVKDMKGEIVDSGIDCTHLVVPKFGRSVKFMCAVARGTPIVTPEWVEKSKKAGHFLDADGFIILDKAEEKRLGFNLKECLTDARECIGNDNKRLFDGYTIYSTESVRPDRGDMKAIVTAAGGRFLENLPKSAPKNEKLVALSCEADSETSEVKRLKTMQVPIVSMEFVLSGLLKREVAIEKYIIFQSETSIDPIKGKKTAKGKK